MFENTHPIHSTLKNNLLLQHLSAEQLYLSYCNDTQIVHSQVKTVDTWHLSLKSIFQIGDQQITLWQNARCLLTQGKMGENTTKIKRDWSAGEVSWDKIVALQIQRKADILSLWLKVFFYYESENNIDVFQCNHNISQKIPANHILTWNNATKVE